MKQICQLVCLLAVLLCSGQPVLGKPWFYFQAPPENQESQSQLSPTQQPLDQSARAPDDSIGPKASGGSSDEDLLFLSDDEVVHNKKVLKSLKHASLREVEELIDNNPVLEALVLKKIQARLEKESQYPVVKFAKPKKVYGYPGVVHHQLAPNQHHNHQHQHHDQHQQQEYLEDLDDDYAQITSEEHDEGDQVVDKKKYDSLKEKLKTNAGKIFKMGSGFKEKYAALRKRYKVKTVVKEYEPEPVAVPVQVKNVEKEKHKIPKFYFDASPKQFVSTEEK